MSKATINYESTGYPSPCDVCQVQDDQPAFFFYQRTIEGNSALWIHERCLSKKLDAAKKRYWKREDEKGMPK